MSDHFADYDEQTTSSSYQRDESSQGSTGGSSRGGHSDHGGYSQEVFSEKISARYRTFFIDVKENANGNLIKISEKSRGKKSTIMFDAEDLDSIITALTNAKNAIDA